MKWLVWGIFLLLVPAVLAQEGSVKLLALAERPNVAVKATCLPLYAGDAYPHRCVHPYLRRVYDSFGRQRIFWGSDITRLPVSSTSYRQAVDMFMQEIPWFTAEDKAWIMGRGLCKWLGWPAAYQS